MSPQDQQTVAQIDAAHIPTRIKIKGKLRRRKVCALDHQRWPCNRTVLARDIRAGIRDHTGNMR